jgi:UDP-GlcNAc:undecaprenyl-phosphate/decaprenyl-phosphate GlcNAc-1-phosphate transferase
VTSRSARAVPLMLGAGLARAAWSALRAAPPGGRRRWDRTNHAGHPITLLEGPAYAAAAATAAASAPGLPPRLRAAALVATLGAAGFGALDDLGETGSSKGLRGHLGELARGRLTTGGAKLLGIAATGLAAAALVDLRGHSDRGHPDRGRGAVDLLASGALVAGCANLVNLLDLRPGRALKAVLLTAPAAISAHPAGALVAAAVGPAAALLPVDLAEQAMLGDTGANAAGALLGTALVAGLGPRARLVALVGVVALTLASEQVSFTRVIEATPGLRELDALGRRPR